MDEFYSIDISINYCPFNPLVINQDIGCPSSAALYSTDAEVLKNTIV